ncbi:hypothetical protein A7P85_08675 [Eikenella corrodens]|uniref:Uncharacterized protein n=1 Tax=Eikenella corrodens TaxID=539 RepID=A0A1A9R9B8_EIKCO|nr:hypothetical protein [Eikenella corrodens]OAM15245.1 hypothetical protein A7P85_08675 [Eikenella corrodens]
MEPSFTAIFTAIGVIASAVSGFITWHNWYQSRQIRCHLDVGPLSDQDALNLILVLDSLEHSDYTVEKISLAPAGQAIISGVDESDALKVSTIDVGWLIPAQAASASAQYRHFIAVDHAPADTDTALLLTVYIHNNLFCKRHKLRRRLPNLKGY